MIRLVAYHYPGPKRDPMPGEVRKSGRSYFREILFDAPAIVQRENGNGSVDLWVLTPSGEGQIRRDVFPGQAADEFSELAPPLQSFTA